jgi:hypothetical protein
MTVQQSADVMMFRNLSQFLAQSAAILDKSSTLKEDATDFQNALAQLEAKIKSINTMSEITGQEKNLLRETIIQESVRYLSILHRHAIKTTNAILKKRTDVKVSALKQMSDANFMAYCNQVAETITENAPILNAALVAITEQNRFLEQIQLFKTVKPQVKLNITRKAVQKEDIEDGVKAIKSKLKKLLDASVLSVEGSDPDFVREYALNRQRREPTKTTKKEEPKLG